MTTPVLKDESSVSLGAVVLTRPTGWLDHRLATLWAWLALVSVVGLVASALTATWLARWVSRPLGGLEATARRLGFRRAQRPVLGRRGTARGTPAGEQLQLDGGPARSAASPGIRR